MNQNTTSYLTFNVRDNIFGIHVSKVVEINEYIQPKSVPESLSFVTGVIEYRDEVLPLIDTAAKFNLGQVELSPQTCIVVLEILNEVKNSTTKIGILVDAVSDVFEASEEALKPIEDDYKPQYISATCKMDDTLVMILDANKVFSEKDIVAMDELVKELK
jgi:purine-binding chemotaxis protein CheW